MSNDDENASIYSTNEITQDLNIVQLYFSQEQADLKLENTQLVNIFDAVQRFQKFEPIPYLVSQCVHKQIQRLKRLESLDNSWKVLWHFVKHMMNTGLDDLSLKRQAELPWKIY